MRFITFNQKKVSPHRILLLTIVFHIIFQQAFSARFLAKREETINENIGDQYTNFSHGGGHQAPVGSPEFYKAIIASTICVISAGFCSGLTVGYLSIQELDLQFCLNGDDEEKKRLAKNIMPIIKQHHLLLSTLLVANALAMESLPIYLHEIFPALYAVLFSTIVVVIFGEIIPQAFCTGPSQLKIANFCIPMVKVLILVFWVICFPIAKLLDFVLGVEHKFLFPKGDLKALINIHVKSKVINDEQYKLIQSLFDLRTDSVEKQMVPYHKVFSVDKKEIITPELIRNIKSHGYSQIPVYSEHKQNVEYIMKTKHLLLCSQPQMGKAIKNRFRTKELLTVKKSSSMLDMLIVFQKTKQTYALIVDEVEVKSNIKSNNPEKYISGVQSSRRVDGPQNEQPKIIGIITLKDVMEEILDQQLLDEDFHKGQCIEIEKLKEKKRQIKAALKEDGENEEQKEEYQQVKKQLQTQKKQLQKQEQLIANAQNKKQKNNIGRPGGAVELRDIDSNLQDPLLQRKQSF